MPRTVGCGYSILVHLARAIAPGSRNLPEAWQLQYRLLSPRPASGSTRQATDGPAAARPTQNEADQGRQFLAVAPPFGPYRQTPPGRQAGSMKAIAAWAAGAGLAMMGLSVAGFLVTRALLERPHRP